MHTHRDKKCDQEEITMTNESTLKLIWKRELYGKEKRIVKKIISVLFAFLKN